MRIEIELDAVDRVLDMAEAAAAKVIDRNHLGNFIDFLKQEAKNAASKQDVQHKGSG